MRKVIAFSLWGDNPKYTIGAIKNAELALKIYPDWMCRYYVGKHIPIETLIRLIEFDNTEICIMAESENWTGMFWRFYPFESKDIEKLIDEITQENLNL